MTIPEDGYLLRIFIGESDRLGHKPLHEAIVLKAREAGLAGDCGAGRDGFRKKQHPAYSEDSATVRRLANGDRLTKPLCKAVNV